MPSPITPALLQTAFIGYDLTFRKALSDAKPIWDKIASMRMSKTEQEVYGWLDVIPELKVWNGPRDVHALSARAQTLVNQLFEDTIGIKRTKLEDDQYGIYSDYVSEMGRVAALWPDLQVTNAILGGGSALVYDNQPYFDTVHPVNMDDPSSPTQSNDFDYSAAGANGTAPGLTAINLADARAKMGALLNSSGVPYQVEPNLLLVPPQQEFQALQILNPAIAAQAFVAQFTGVAATGVGAATGNVLKGLMDVLKAPRLASSPNYVYLLDTTRSTKPFIWQLREAPEFAYRFRPEDPAVFDFDEYLAGVRARGAAGYGPWYLAARMKIS